ncbi:MAG: hypothetical protein LJE70_18195 [Chromatiaceae bacterium]|nr:hypothetical protein [Chromatiaceae bacterium]
MQPTDEARGAEERIVRIAWGDGEGVHSREIAGERLEPCADLLDTRELIARCRRGQVVLPSHVPQGDVGYLGFRIDYNDSRQNVTCHPSSGDPGGGELLLAVA